MAGEPNSMDQHRGAFWWWGLSFAKNGFFQKCSKYLIQKKVLNKLIRHKILHKKVIFSLFIYSGNLGKGNWKTDPYSLLYIDTVFMGGKVEVLPFFQHHQLMWPDWVQTEIGHASELPVSIYSRNHFRIALPIPDFTIFHSIYVLSYFWRLLSKNFSNSYKVKKKSRHIQLGSRDYFTRFLGLFASNLKSRGRRGSKIALNAFRVSFLWFPGQKNPLPTLTSYHENWETKGRGSKCEKYASSGWISFRMFSGT